MILYRRVAAFLAFIAGAILSLSAAIPSGYYDDCEGKTGKALLEALYSTITSHTTVSYSGLWDLYKTSDVDENGKIWDMYSTKRWNPGTEQCGQYGSVGDCYNREHSFPKSWFDDASPMVSDAFHIYPTDGKVNGQRSNYPFGECSGGTYLPSSGGVRALGRLGRSTFAGYSGTVFEPDDMYKGDFARSYFYMAACYNDRIAGWSSPMLAGNSYPAYTTWAVNLLMKWTRQDEVSQKELDRQEAVYARQHNRNPFIDHPELAEYIWGDKVGTPWYSTSTATPKLTHPVEGSTLSMGYAAVGVARTESVYVKGTNITATARLFVSGASGLSVSPSALTAAQVNQGYNVTVSLTAATAGDVEGYLNVVCGDLTSEVPVTCTVEDGLPIYDASNISSESFLVRWIYLNDATSYTLHVKQGTEYVAGYPKSITASTGSYEVTGLEPSTPYTFYLTSGALLSSTKGVTTAEAQPYIGISFDGTLAFTALPGVPSAEAEVLLDIENISEVIGVEVDAPFQVSTDKSNWSTYVTLAPEEDRFYLRVMSDIEGSFTTYINVACDTYVNDETMASATVGDAVAPDSFVEDWEEVVDPTTAVKPYSTTEFAGSACRWRVVEGGFGTGSQDKAFNGSVALRMNKNKVTSLTMAEDKTGGIGTVTFDAAKWPNSSDNPASITVYYSTDGGSTWTEAGSVMLTETTSKAFSVDVNVSGNARIKFESTDTSGRWFIDNIALSNYSPAAIDNILCDTWDAYCSGGRLVVECKDKAHAVAVYGIDGITYVSETLACGIHTFNLAPGLYVVTADDYSRRVLVK